MGLLDVGKGMVFMDHAIAAWLAWEEYADIVGGRFLYQAGELREKKVPDSGYRLDTTNYHKVTLSNGIGSEP
tara:strand:+ start:463 stop:678 length:216 start_codon:yes stop_codon:yes gene_type:complete